MKFSKIKPVVRARHAFRQLQEFVLERYISDSVFERDTRYKQLLKDRDETSNDYDSLAVEFDDLLETHTDEVRRRESIIREQVVSARQEMGHHLDRLVDLSLQMTNIQIADAKTVRAQAREEVAEATAQQRYLKGRLRDTNQRMRDLETGRAIVPTLKFLEHDSRYRKGLRGIYLDSHHNPAYASPALTSQFDVTESFILGAGIPELLTGLSDATGTHCVQFSYRDKPHKFERTPYQIRDPDGELVGTFIHYDDAAPSLLKRLGHSREISAVWNLLERTFGPQGYSFG